MRGRGLVPLVVVALIAGSCRKKEPAIEGFGVTFDEDALELVLWHDDDALLVFPSDGLQLGTVDALDDTRSYDPFWPDGAVTWRSMVAAEPLASVPPDLAPAAVALDLTFEGDLHASLVVVERGAGSFEARLVPDGGTVAYHRLRPRADAEEGFYGLGEVFDTPNHRGKARAMQLEIDTTVESFNNEAHVPVPLLIGTTGWGLFVADRHPGLFEVATEADDLVQVTFGTGMDSADGLTFHLYGAEHPLDVTRHYYDTTGDPLLPARWGLGPWVWRDENDDQAQVSSDLNTIRDLDLATSAYWIDRPYASGVNTFDFDPGKFPDPEGMIAEAHALGFRVALWHVPYVSEEQSPALHAEAEAGGYFPPEAPIFLNNWSHPIDLSNPDAYDWWQALIRRYTDMGIEGFKLDYAEDILVGANGARMGWSFWDGQDERTMHKVYPLLYHRVYAETLPETGGFLLCRTGTWGDQVNVSVLWPGDLDATMDLPYTEAVDRDGEDYTAVGGLPAAVVASVSTGPSGFPFYGSDTGGYRHAPPDKETFTRWFQHTALATVMQIGTNSNDVAWEFEAENGFDEEMLGWYRDYTRLHLRLFPYVWTYAERLAVDGRPIQRPLGLAHPELGVHPPHDYLLGDDLLVAPVVEYGARSRAVTFPEGRWIHWFTGEVFEGQATVDAPLDTLPLFLREGGIVPLLRPTIDTLSPTSEPDRVDSYATTPGVLWARVFPGPASRFELFDGAAIAQEATSGGVTLEWADGDEFVDGAVLELLDRDAPSEVAIDGTPWGEDASLEAGWRWDAATRTLWIRVPSGSGTITVTGG